MNKVIEAENGSGGRPTVLLLPNLLTIARIAAVPLIVALLLIDGAGARWTALVLFVAAALTDYVDGYVARKLSQRSALGVMLDPIADKLLVAAALVMLVADGTIAGVHVIAAVVILAREVLISGLREYLAGISFEVPVSKLAKWKTAIQLVALSVLMSGQAGEAVAPGVLTIGTAMLWLAALLTVTTGYDYLKTGIARVIAEDDQ
ncbi:MAG: CDP-diacylglycerol--glycerol-3-phosphate 3-phosphatidyltransferase [Rhizobiales bacterium]|nr:CDP-diacylglycerol--glycerol-3-phosphate 3-phosphatidyltransferase [Hyphomicrobiales bacterium]